ncbi:MAG: NAD-dependent deacylase [Rubrobacter sp.]|nr:NAD-dependent deacylase [Rubrobacter sp.]
MISALRGSSRTTVLTGSGISAESGIPTFREAQTGLWERFDPKELATPEAFARDPSLVWDWYAWRRKLVAEARPNPGHVAIAEMRRLVPNFALVTQNVDGLHQEAGSREVIELHGNIRRTKCSVEDTMVEDYDEGESPPYCPSCGAPLRPDVVWFGEMLPPEALEAASMAVRGSDLLLSVGTSSLVYPAAWLPFEALENGAIVVEINPSETPLTRHADYTLRGLAGDVLPRLIRELS